MFKNIYFYSLAIFSACKYIDPSLRDWLREELNQRRGKANAKPFPWPLPVPVSMPMSHVWVCTRTHRPCRDPCQCLRIPLVSHAGASAARWCICCGRGVAVAVSCPDTRRTAGGGGNAPAPAPVPPPHHVTPWIPGARHCRLPLLPPSDPRMSSGLRLAAGSWHAPRWAPPADRWPGGGQSSCSWRPWACHAAYASQRFPIRVASGRFLWSYFGFFRRFFAAPPAPWPVARSDAGRWGCGAVVLCCGVCLSVCT